MQLGISNIKHHIRDLIIEPEWCTRQFVTQEWLMNIFVVTGI